MTKFWELLRESIICQSLLTIGFAAGVLYLSMAGKDVPPEMWQALWAILGFWFGSKVGHDAAITAASRKG